MQQPHPARNAPAWEYADILGVHVALINVEQAIDRILALLAARQKAIVSYVNVHTVNLVADNPWLRRFINQSDFTYCDGFGIKWGARLLGYRIPGRFTPPDWFPQLAVQCAARGHRLFLLGGLPGVADAASAWLQSSSPGLAICGVQHGYWDKTPGGAENEAVLRRINQAAPDLLVLGMGMPIQERWLIENWTRVNASVALPVGAMFDYLSGSLPRAPRCMTDHGLEWLGRLAIEPRRLGSRYLLGNPRFLFNVLRQRLFGWRPSE
ncbi:MAG: WecB/TagA/CpsF family glycosyltransferase [Chloroflexi bacterium]|nr:WecB/TagA/CpsF family glycosyltransferase [Chloroflexota bacterium]